MKGTVTTYCCVAVVSGKLARENPAAAAKVTRALFKACKWVQENSIAAGKLTVAGKYAAASEKINCHALAKLKYDPGVEKCKKSIASAVKEMQQAGLLSKKTDPDELARKAWIDLDGVTDEFIRNIKVAQVPDGGRPALLRPGEVAAL